MKKIIYSLLLAILSSSTFAHADLVVAFHTWINGAPLQYNTNYVVNGTTINISNLSYYVSNIRFIKDDNTEEIFDTIMLVRGNQIGFAIGETLTKNYIAVKFDIGLDSVINHADPALNPIGHPLGLQNPDTHWSWNSGYKLFRIDGTVDTSPNQTAGPTETLQFHIGTDALSKKLEYTVSFSLDGSEVTPIRRYEAQVVLNVENLFSNINLREDNSTATMDNMPLAVAFVNNYFDAFNFEDPQLITGIREQNLFAKNVSIFPNPATQQLSVESQDVQNNAVLYVYDINGKKVAQGKFINGKALLNIEALNKGIYILKQKDLSGAVRFVKN